MKERSHSYQEKAEENKQTDSSKKEMFDVSCYSFERIQYTYKCLSYKESLVPNSGI